MSYLLYVGPLVSRDDASWGETPPYHSPDLEYVAPGRRVLELLLFSWPHLPEDCPSSREYGTQWLFGDTVLVCTGCGLDCT